MATRARLLAVATLVLVGLPSMGSTRHVAAETVGYRTTVVGAELRGVVTIATGTMFGGTEVGGLSGLTYDAAQDVYYAVSDDRSSRNAARFYHITADTRDGNLDPGDVRVTGVVTLTDDAGQTFGPGSVDPEGIALSGDNSLFVASEGDVTQSIPPFVRSFSMTGRQRDEIPLPDAFLPDATGQRGVRNNLALESLAISPDGRTLHTGTESSLLQDGPPPTVSAGSPSRILNFDLELWSERSQQVYPLAAVPAAPEPPTGAAENGLVELAVLDDFGTVLALERAFVTGRGVTTRLFESRTVGEVDVSSRMSLLSASGAPVMIEPAPMKQLIADISAMGVVPDNIEGMALGPVLSDGKRFLLLVSDNNFSPLQTTQFVGLALTLARTPVVAAEAEIPPQQSAVPFGAPAIWHDPGATGETRLVAARGGSGLAQIDLQGRVLAAVPVASAPSAVALVPRFFDGDVDTALVVTTGTDNLLRFQVTSRVPPDFHSVTRGGTDTVPFPDEPAGEPLGPIAAFTLPASGAQVLVAERLGHRVAQLALRLSPTGGVYGEVLRMLEIPMVPAAQAGAVVVGVVAGNEGTGYVAVAGEGIFGFGLDPTGPADVSKVYDLAATGGDVAGMAWLEAPGVGPVLLVSRTGDGALVVLDAGAAHGVVGELVIGAGGDVDGADRPMGISAVGGDNVGLMEGDGLIVVVDAMDDPQDVVEVDGRLVNRLWNAKIAPWSSDLLSVPPGKTPTPGPTPIPSGTPVRPAWSIYVPSVAQGR